VRHSGKAYRRGVAALFSLIVGLCLVIPVAQADVANSNPGVLSPEATHYGKTYGEWSASFWQYLYSIPSSLNPALDPTGAQCGVDQSGPVFFLVGTFTTTTPVPGGDVFGTANRGSCTAPAGAALFFPILNAECSTAEGNGTTDAELRACAVGFIDSATNLAAEVDGVSIQGLHNTKTTIYRAQSPLFTFDLPAHNILGLRPQSSPSVSDGVYLMLAPLTPGQHRIHFHGQAPLSPTANFVLDVTYDKLTVR
jgi:hypothetical protein